jgi:hypothetical protein
MQDTLLSRASLERGYYQPGFLAKLVQKQLSGENHAVRIGALMAIELWHQRYIKIKFTHRQDHRWMLKLGVVINETWAFFKEIYDHLGEHHQTTLYQPKEVRVPLFCASASSAPSSKTPLPILPAVQDVVFLNGPATCWRRLPICPKPPAGHPPAPL